MEDQHFTEFRQQSYLQLRGLKTTDIVPFTATKVESNYTILAIPNADVITQVQTFITELKAIDSSQYFYKPEQLHITLLGGIPMHMSKDEFISRSRPVLAKYKIKFQIVGLGSNQNCSSVLAYPDGFSLHNLREELRHALHEKGTPYDIHLSRYEYMGWMNYMRYLTYPKEELLTALKNNEDRFFGALPMPNIELFKATSKVLQYYPEDELLYSYT